jgi:hypothetical protein
MSVSKLFRFAVPLAAAASSLAWIGGANASVFNGNGATGFGGPVGKGNVTITDNGAGSVTFVFNPAPSHPSGVDSNNLVLYLSTGATGLADTSTLVDDGDNGGTGTTIDSGREGISGYNDGSAAQGNPQNPPSRSLVAFPTGFQATYAIAMEGGFVGLFKLPPATGNGLLTFVDGANQTMYPLSLTIPFSEIGLSQGSSFSLVGTLIDGTAAYRSNEAIGDALLNPPSSPGTSLAKNSNPGFNNLISFTDFDTYNSQSVPEPAALGFLALGATLMPLRRRAKSAH